MFFFFLLFSFYTDLTFVSFLRTFSSSVTFIFKISGQIEFFECIFHNRFVFFLSMGNTNMFLFSLRNDNNENAAFVICFLLLLLLTIILFLLAFIFNQSQVLVRFCVDIFLKLKQFICFLI